MRGENTIGLVIERVRKGTELTDGLFWFCENCNNELILSFSLRKHRKRFYSTLSGILYFRGNENL
jgi:hypothetical protein